MHIQNKTLFHASEVINQPEQFQAGLNKLTNIKKMQDSKFIFLCQISLKSNFIPKPQLNF